MTLVYIGNATKQNLSFAYKLPERKSTITQHIPWGWQKSLAEDMSQMDIDAIFEQWGKYGLIKTDELESHRHNFQGYLISVGKPIKFEVMEKAAKYREDILKAKGKAFREEAAIAMINTIEHQAGAVARHYEVSVAEEIPSHGFSDSNVKNHIAEGWRADRDARPNMPPAPTTKRRRRAA